MKKLLIVFLMVFMFMSSIYAETEYKVMNFDEVLTEEGIEHDFSNYTESDDKITIYFFRGKGCKFCRAFLSYLNDIVPEYGKYFNVVAYDVWNDRNSDKLLDEVSEFLNQPSEGIPYAIIGDTVFNGYSTDYDEAIKETIKKEYNKKKRYDVLFEMKESKENENKVDFTPVYVTCGIISLVTISGFVYSTIRINKLSNDIKELSKKNKVKKGKSK